MISNSLLKTRIILSKKQCLLQRIRNETVVNVNNYMLIFLHGGQKEYLSFDSIGNDKKSYKSTYSISHRFLNTLKFSEIPNHELDLKIGVPVMLLRNLNLRKEICNGTILLITSLDNMIIKAEILTEINNLRILIPKISLTPTEARWSLMNNCTLHYQRVTTIVYTSRKIVNYL